jgi:DnaA family protein
MRQVPLALVSEAVASFESYVPGPNAAALDHLCATLPPAVPVYLWGAAGSGKSHLLQALALEVHRAGARVGSFGPGAALPWAFDPAWALVVIDDVQALDAAAQHAAFALLVDAQTHGVPWAAAGQAPPVDLPLREDLRTRLAWGHVFALQPLGEAETRAVLRREADRRGLLLTDEVIAYLLTRFTRDLPSLLDLLDRLDEFSLSLKRPLTVPLLKTMLASTAPADEAAA